MKRDIDYEIDKYIDEQADEYMTFGELLENRGITLDEVRHEVKKFREKFNRLLEKYSISGQNLVTTCRDLMELMDEDRDNPELQYIYFCIMTDSGVLSGTGDTEEQDVRNYLRQVDSIGELTEFAEVQSENNVKLYEFRKYLKKAFYIKNTDFAEEQELIYQLTIQHTFLYESIGNHVYRDNLDELISYINSDEKLQSVKPYIIFAVLTRKHGMMQNRENFIPNIRNVFQYQSYNIMNDNGKNFNNYQSYIELYDNLRSCYMDDEITDTEFCDFCFANLSPLSEWYYMNCEPNEDIPTNLRLKIMGLIPDSFPMILDYEGYNELDDDEIQLYGDAEEKLKRSMLDEVNRIIEIEG
jgi:hypothetical protein